MTDRASPLNFSQRNALLQLVKEHRKVLNDRCTSLGMVHKKKLAWEEIRKAFTAMNPDMEPRSVQQLRRSYSRIKQSMKKEEKLYQKELTAAGDGPPTPKFSEEHELLTEMIKPEMKRDVKKLPEMVCLGIPSGDSSQHASDIDAAPSSPEAAAILPSISCPSSTEPTSAAQSSPAVPASVCSAPESGSEGTTTSSFGATDVPHRDVPRAIHAGPRGTKRRFVEEYEGYRRKQDMYYDLLIQQTKEEHEEQMRVYKAQLEVCHLKKEECELKRKVVEESLKMIKKTCTHWMKMADEWEGGEK